MSKKVLTSMKDENPDLQKQMGCISGFFQLFDRHWFLTGGHNQNKPPPGEISNEVKELNYTMQKATANNVKVARENQQFSTESSGTSVSSSSCSSSMSSLEFNRTILSQIKISENSNSGEVVKPLGTPVHQSLDFYDIVKDSMQREPQGLTVKTAAKEEKKGRILKHIDSPRPLQAAKSVNTGVMVANEPFHILAKSQKKPWDLPRHSYDERDIQQIFKCTTKHKEIPRLSLDSREGSIRGSNEATKSHNLLKGSQRGYGSSSKMLRQHPSKMLRQHQEPETSKRPSSVVAKLMGLEEFPDCTQTCNNPLRMSSCSTNRNDTYAKSSMTDGYNQHQSPVYPITSKGSLVRSRRDNASITNATPYSRFSLEPTPWRQPDASQDSQLQVSKGSETSITASKPSHSVYGEIEKRISDLQFKNSGKDLRALKQILEAMQRHKDSLDITSDQVSNHPSDRTLSESSKSQGPRIQQINPTPVTDEMSNSTRGRKLPIVIMKPAQVTRKTNNPASTETSINGKSGRSKFCPGNPTNGRLVDKLDSQTAEGTRISKLTQFSKVPQVINGENTTNFSHTAETRSPRVQKKYGLERRSPTSPSSDSRSNRRQHKQLLESSSPNTTPRQEVSTLQQRNEGFSKISCQRRDFKHEVDAISPNVDSNRSMDSHSDIEGFQVDHSLRNNSISIQLNGQNQNNAAKELSKDSVMAETIVTAEQPSPVSVLDPVLYKEDPPSPVKKKSQISEDLDEALDTYDSMEHISDLPLSSNNRKAYFSNGISDNDFETQNLVQILQQIDYNDEKFTNFRESKDEDRKYISEILVASGLLSSHSSTQAVHSPGHPINPKLLLALEQIKTNKLHFNIEQNARKIVRMNNQEEMQRKLIFDVVNDILLQKLTLENSSTPWCLPNQPAGGKLNGQQLLDEICTEIQKLRHKNRNVGLDNEYENLTSLLWGDLMHQPTIWTECHSEIPNIVLDIERLIFKDLITEVVRGEVANHPGRRCRKLLFPK